MVALATCIRRLGLADLLLQFLVFDLGDALAAADAVAEPHVDLFEPAGGSRNDRDGGIANQVADDDQLLLDGIAARALATSHGHRTSRTRPPRPPPPPPRRRASPATCPASRRGRRSASAACADSRLNSAGVERRAGESHDGDTTDR